MDMVQPVIINAGWIFFTGWGMALAAVSVIAFGRDILRGAQRVNVDEKRR